MPQQNKVSKRANRTIVEMAQFMIHAQCLSHELMSNKAVERRTSDKIWSGRMPHISHMCIFGWVAYAKVSDQMRTKLDTKCVKRLFLGYCEGTKAYLLICLETRNINEIPDMVFLKDKTHLKDCPSGRIDEGLAIKDKAKANILP